MIRRLAEKLWSVRKESRIARTAVLKLKTSEFKILTRSHTLSSPPTSCKQLTEIALKLRERVDLGRQQRYRLIGVGLSNFRQSEQTGPSASAFRVTRDQSAAAAPAGCWRIISSIFCFISFAVGSALWVPTIHV
jgi:impB/mucB/samB family C-terminal domain